jgi:tetratricopeptide (TPR) repeat protein
VLAVVALEEQRAEEALQALRRAEELGADRLGLDYFLGRTWLALGQVEQAESSFQRALSETSDERVRDEIEVLLASIEQRAHKFPYEEENR